MGRCRRHPRVRVVGVCHACLRERLLELVEEEELHSVRNAFARPMEGLDAASISTPGAAATSSYHDSGHLASPLHLHASRWAADGHADYSREDVKQLAAFYLNKHQSRASSPLHQALHHPFSNGTSPLAAKKSVQSIEALTPRKKKSSLWISLWTKTNRGVEERSKEMEDTIRASHHERSRQRIKASRNSLMREVHESICSSSTLTAVSPPFYSSPMGAVSLQKPAAKQLSLLPSPSRKARMERRCSFSELESDRSVAGSASKFGLSPGGSAGGGHESCSPSSGRDHKLRERESRKLASSPSSWVSSLIPSVRRVRSLSQKHCNMTEVDVSEGSNSARSGWRRRPLMVDEVLEAESSAKWTNDITGADVHHSPHRDSYTIHRQSGAGVDASASPARKSTYSALLRSPRMEKLAHLLSINTKPSTAVAVAGSRASPSHNYNRRSRLRPTRKSSSATVSLDCSRSELARVSPAPILLTPSDESLSPKVDRRRPMDNFKHHHRRRHSCSDARGQELDQRQYIDHNHDIKQERRSSHSGSSWSKALMSPILSLKRFSRIATSGSAPHEYNPTSSDYDRHQQIKQLHWPDLIPQHPRPKEHFFLFNDSKNPAGKYSTQHEPKPMPPQHYSFLNKDYSAFSFYFSPTRPCNDGHSHENSFPDGIEERHIHHYIDDDIIDAHVAKNTVGNLRHLHAKGTTSCGFGGESPNHSSNPTTNLLHIDDDYTPQAANHPYLCRGPSSGRSGRGRF